MSEGTVMLADLISSGLHSAGDRIEEEIKANDTVSTAAIAWTLVKSEVESKLKEALSIDPLEVIAAAWSKGQELKKYTDPAQYPADQSVVVHLGEHKVTYRVHPEIDISFNDVPIPPIKFTLELVAKFKTAALTIRGGVIRSVSPGSCSAQAVLKYGSVKLKEEETQEVRFSGRVDLGEGLRIA